MLNKHNTWTSEALQRGDLEAIKQRVGHEPEYLHERDYLGDTPLRTAIACGELSLVQFLLEQGADPNVEVDDGYTCLLTAVESKCSEAEAIVAELLAAGADLHATGLNGWTALHLAASSGYVEKARLLLAAGARVDQRTEIDGCATPLMEASTSGQAGTVKLLLEHGADASLRDIFAGRTPLDMARYAAAGPDLKIYRFLKQENLACDPDDLLAGLDASPEELAMLKQSFAEVDLAKTYLENSQHLAQAGNHKEVIRILTDHAAKKNR